LRQSAFLRRRGGCDEKFMQHDVDTAYMTHYVDTANLNGGPIRRQPFGGVKMVLFGLVFLTMTIVATLYFT
jgi:hypothetical protein